MYSKSDSFFDELMVEIPGGKIQLKDESTQNTWQVEVKPFLLAKYPVTRDFYIFFTEGLSVC
ncbi:MAG: formylglycine-generating enzyme family protein, partial [bacterium]